MNTFQQDVAILSRWKHWGAGFNVPPCKGPVNLEQLLVDTAKGIPANPRLFTMAVTWLAEHHMIVDVDHLARLAEKLRGVDSAAMGLLLEIAGGFARGGVFDRAIAVCQPWQPPQPLFIVCRTSTAMIRLAEQSASEASRKWGLWADPIVSLKREALRPPDWIAQANPTFLLRGLLKGDVRSRVIIALAEEELADVSETELTRRAGCTRRAMHLAIENLTAAGLIVKRRRGRSYAISLCRLAGRFALPTPETQGSRSRAKRGGRQHARGSAFRQMTVKSLGR